MGVHGSKEYKLHNEDRQCSIKLKAYWYKISLYQMVRSRYITRFSETLRPNDVEEGAVSGGDSTQAADEQDWD